MVTTVKVGGEDRIAVLFPFYDEEDCIESMADGLWQVLEVVADSEEAKQNVPTHGLGQLVKMCKMLSQTTKSA